MALRTIVILFFILNSPFGHASKENQALLTQLESIKNFHFVSDQLASSGILKLSKYQYIKDYGFKHVVNLIPGDQTNERARVESLGMTYEQIPVEWSEPTLENFEQFAKLLKSYGNDKVYVHCEANYRASTFVFLFRTLRQGVAVDIAEKDLHRIWTPNDTWQLFIDKNNF